MKIFFAGLILSCALAVTVSQDFPLPSSDDFQCFQRVISRNGLSSCLGLTTITSIKSICSNTPCIDEIVQVYRSCGRSDIADAANKLCGRPVVSIGLIVGVSVAGFILVIVIPITIICIVACCVSSRRRTRITTTAMSAAPYAVVSNSSSSQQAYHPAPNTLQEKAPPPYADPQKYAPYPPQQ